MRPLFVGRTYSTRDHNTYSKKIQYDVLFPPYFAIKAPQIQSMAQHQPRHQTRASDTFQRSHIIHYSLAGGGSDILWENVPGANWVWNPLWTPFNVFPVDGFWEKTCQVPQTVHDNCTPSIIQWTTAMDYCKQDLTLHNRHHPPADTNKQIATF